MGRLTVALVARDAGVERRGVCEVMAITACMVGLVEKYHVKDMYRIVTMFL